jgi:hypothetical protein
MAFGGEVQDRVGPELREDGVDRRAIADVDLVVAVPIAGSRLSERFEIARVGQLVDVGDGPVRVADDVTHDGRADEAGAAGNKNSHGAITKRAGPALLCSGECPKSGDLALPTTCSDSLSNPC